MDAIKFLKEKNRMCSSYDGCAKCPADNQNNGFEIDCEVLECDKPEEFVDIVERWSDEHPIKTRQSEFLKMFPNASMDGNGSVGLCPISVDSTFSRDSCYSKSCIQCKKDFWLEAVD